MQSSTTVALRALAMLVCAVGIPVLAMSGASWSEIVKKFQNLRWPAVVEFASAATPAPRPLSEAPQSRPPKSADATSIADIPPLPEPAVAPSPPASALTGRSDQLPEAASTARISSDVDIPKRLQQLGATYYVLESWGNNELLYRFYCKMAVTENSDYTHCFEATDADPRQAMQSVLRQVESWRDAASHGG
jgi:hypothetical protein